MCHRVTPVAHMLVKRKKANFISRCEQFIADIISRHQRCHFKLRSNISLKKEQTMTDNILIDLSMDFAISIVNMCESIKGKSALTNQILRSGTSIGANIHEANYAQSKADFINKMQIALKECHETEYWLKLFSQTAIIDEEIYKNLSGKSGKIRRVLIASLNTAKGN